MEKRTTIIILSVAGGVATLCCGAVAAIGAMGTVLGWGTEPTESPRPAPVVTTHSPAAAPAAIASSVPPPSSPPAAPTTTAAAPPAAPAKYSDKARFPTGRYADEVRVRIDNLVAAKDCRGLQGEFDQAAANDAAQRARTGSGTADLMTYIDGALKAAGCY